MAGFQKHPEIWKNIMAIYTDAINATRSRTVEPRTQQMVPGAAEYG